MKKVCLMPQGGDRFSHCGGIANTGPILPASTSSLAFRFDFPSVNDMDQAILHPCRTSPGKRICAVGPGYWVLIMALYSHHLHDPWPVMSCCICPAKKERHLCNLFWIVQIWHEIFQLFGTAIRGFMFSVPGISCRLVRAKDSPGYGAANSFARTERDLERPVFEQHRAH